VCARRPARLEKLQERKFAVHQWTSFEVSEELLTSRSRAGGEVWLEALLQDGDSVLGCLRHQILGKGKGGLNLGLFEK